VLEGSAPRILHGHNVSPVLGDDLDEAVELALDAASEALADDLLREHVAVRRVDVVRDFRMSRPELFLARIGPRLSGSVHTYRAPDGTVGSQVVSALTSGWRVTAYAKERHLGVASADPGVMTLAKDRLRVEVGMRHRYLRGRGVEVLGDLNPRRVTELARDAITKVGLSQPIGLGNAADLIARAQADGSQVERAIGMLVVRELTGHTAMSEGTRLKNQRILATLGLTGADLLERESAPRSRLDFDLGTLRLDD